MFGHLHTPFTEVKDLSPDESLCLTALKMGSAVGADFGSMNDDLVGLGDLPERYPLMAELSTDFLSRFLPEATCTRDLLPR
jgi:hypothetical protein